MFSLIFRIRIDYPVFLYNTNWLAFVMEMQCVCSMVGTEILPVINMNFVI
jgi:hypothetical protein